MQRGVKLSCIGLWQGVLDKLTAVRLDVFC